MISASYNTEVNADSRFREEGVDFKDRADLQLTGLVRPEHAGEGEGVGSRMISGFLTLMVD